MSLEKEIADLADAINSNTIALHANTMALKLANGEAPDATEPAKTEKAKAEKKAQAAATKAVDTPPTAEVAETAPAPKADSSDAKPASKEPKADVSDDSPINFQEEISAPIVAMCKAGHRKTALAILEKYGAANASSLDKRHYVAVRADIAVALAEQAEDMA